MRGWRAAICLLLIAALPVSASVRWRVHRHGYSHHRAGFRLPSERYRPPVIPLPLSVRCGYRLRDWRGHFVRCSAARAAFERDNPCPSTGQPTGACPGYVVDHIIPLKRGGADLPSNMQWQTVEDAKAKDRIE